MSELTEKLRVHPTASHFLKPAHLYQSLIEERTEAADALEAQETRIEALEACLRLAVDLVERDVIRVRPSDQDELIEALTAWNVTLSKAPSIK